HAPPTLPLSSPSPPPPPTPPPFPYTTLFRSRFGHRVFGGHSQPQPGADLVRDPSPEKPFARPYHVRPARRVPSRIAVRVRHVPSSDGHSPCTPLIAAVFSITIPRSKI